MAGRIWFARIALVLGLLIAGGWGGGTPVRAELSDEEYKKLRAEATELLHLRISEITVIDSKPEMVKYRVEATVDQVDRSARGFSRGARLAFDSYYVPMKARNGYTGPESPPQLYPGWTGWVFLGKSKAGNGLEPAAHGRSFHYSYDLKP